MWSNFSILNDEKVIDNTFSINSLFRISSTEIVSELPRVQAIFYRGRVAIAIEDGLTLFENESFKNCKYIPFDSKVDCMTISSNGNLVLCALNNGTIHGVHIKGIPVFTLEINPDHVFVDAEKTFVSIEERKGDFLLTSRTGFIYKISNIGNDELNQIIHEIEDGSSSSLNETLLNNVNLEVISSIRLQSSVICSSSAHFFQEETITLSTKELVYLFKNSIDGKIPLPIGIGSISKIQSCNTHLIALSSTGKLFELCPYSEVIMPIKCENKNICDINLVKSGEQTELQMLSKTNDNHQMCLEIFDFPSLKIKMKLEVPRSSWFVLQLEQCANIYYLSGNVNLSTSLIDKIELCKISDIDPHKRLNTLIQKGLLEEAESFAMSFNLSLQPIYEAKARRILVEISKLEPINKNEAEKRFEELLNLLKMITNIDLLLQMRNLEMYDRKTMKTFLEYLIQRIDCSQYSKEFEEINEQLLRLETLRLIDHNECDIYWQKFVNHPNILKCCFTFFEKDMSIACLILRQHASSILPQLKENTVTKTLNKIPNSVEPFDIIQWMRHYLPIVSKVHSKAFPELGDWIIAKTKSYQTLNEWPEIGLEFANAMLKIFQEVDFLFPDFRHQYDICIERFQKIISALEELYVLKVQFNLKISIDEYLENSIEESAYRILMRTNLKNLQKLVEEFLFTIFNEKGFDLLPTLNRYIDYLIRNRKRSAMWEDRAVACALLLHKEEEKLKAVIKILKSASVPWSKSLDPILKYRESSHPFSSEILNQFQMHKLKIIRIKYGWDPEKLLVNKKRFLFRIVKVNSDDLIKDVKDFIEGDSDLKDFAYYYCPTELARRECADKAIAFLDSSNENDCIKHCENLIPIIVKLMEDELANEATFDGLMELAKFAISKTSVNHLKKSFFALMSLQVIRRELNIKLPLDALTKINTRNIYLEQVILAAVNYLKNLQNGYAQYAWSLIEHISKVFEMNFVLIAYELMKLVNHIQFSCYLTRILLENVRLSPENCSSYEEIALFLLARQCQRTEDLFGEAYEASMAYPLAYVIFVQAEKNGATDLIQLIQFTRIGHDSFGLEYVRQYLEAKVDNNDEILSSVFEKLSDQSTKSQSNNDHRRTSMNIFEEVRNAPKAIEHNKKCDIVIKCLSFALNIIVNDMNANTKFVSKLKSFVLTDDIIQRTDFFTTLEQIIKAKMYRSAFTIIHFIRLQQPQSKIVVIGNDTMSMFIKKIVKSALNHKEPNFDLILPILKSDSDAQKILDFLKKDFKSGLLKVNFLTLQEKLSATKSNKNEVNIEKESRLKYYYFMQLSKMDPSLKSDMNFDFDSYEQLFKVLRNKVIDVLLLEKMSQDFNWNFQKVLVHQVILILQMQELEFDIEIDIMGKEQISMRTSAQKIRSICQPYIDRINDNTYFASQLYEFIATINSYFYELYLCVIEILTEIRKLKSTMKLWTNILLFLKHKMIGKRNVCGGQMETDWWLQKSETGILPKIAKYRFPFKMIIEKPLKDLLDEEMTMENCTEWFPLIELHLNLKKPSSIQEIYKEEDHYCMSAVKNSIGKYKQNHSSDSWNLQPINNAFLQTVLHLVSKIHDIQRKIFVLYFVCNHAPEGADQVEAAEECFKFALKHSDELMQMDRSREMVEKIRRKYPMLKTQHLLHLYGLKNDVLMELVEDPIGLITKLYDYITESKIDINKVAEEISVLHAEDFYAIQIKLLESWLSFDSHITNQTLEDTLCENLDDSINKHDDDDDVNVDSDYVQKAYYILRCWDSQKSVEFLASHVFASEDESSVNTGRQLQLMNCLMKFVTDDMERSFIDLVSQPQYIALKCVHHLNSLGFKLSIRRFITYDKVKILKQVWSSNANNSKALEVIIYICIGYDIYEPIIWNGLLKQMVNLHMTKSIEQIIDTISLKPALQHIEGLTSAWNYLIRMPLKEIINKRSTEQDSILCRSLFLLQSCPIKSKIDLVEIGDICVRMNQCHIAAILLAFVNEQQKEKLIKILKTALEKIETKNQLINDINSLNEFGIYPFVINIAKTELNGIN